MTPLLSHFSRAQALTAVSTARAAGKKIIFTSGAFDLLHAGHVAYLEYAKSLGGFLVVGINSDASVARYKDPRRPICPELSRCSVVAGLRSVDAVFLFDETNNNENILLIKPDLYVKAGDYSKEKLSSGSLVTAYGGSVVIAPFEQGFSSSSIIERVRLRYGDCESAEALTSEELPPLGPAVFVDRDGTINELVEYLSEPEKFKFIPHAIEGIALLKQMGFRVVITTNQPGIGQGYFTREDFFRVNRMMLQGFDAAGVKIDKIYFCPDSYSIESDFRKPAPGMIQRGKRELNVDLSSSYVVGDMSIDVEFARRAGCKSVLVKTGKGGTDGRYPSVPTMVAVDLLDAAKKIVTDYEQQRSK